MVDLEIPHPSDIVHNTNLDYDDPTFWIARRRYGTIRSLKKKYKDWDGDWKKLMSDPEKFSD